MGSVMNSGLMPNVTLVTVGTQAATITLPGPYCRKKMRIKEVRFINQTALAADNTNFLQVSLQDSSSNVYASLDTRAANQGALVANVGTLMPLTTPDDADANHPEKEVPAGAQLQVVVTKNGTGVPTLAQLAIEWYPL